MNKTMKKALAILCAVAMIISSITIYNNTTSAAVADLPESGTGVVVSVNDFGNGEVLFVAGLDTITGATSYNLYMDGTLWGTVTNGANLEITNFPSGAHEFCVTGLNADGEFARSRNITVTIPSHEMDTTPEIVDGTELLQGVTFADADTTTDEATQDALWIELGGTYTNNGDGSVSIAIPAYESGNNYDTQMKQNKVQLIKDKWYKATYTVTSDVDKTIQLLVQQNVNWTVFKEEITSVAAGETKDVEVVFKADQTTDKVLFGFMMGYVNNTACEAANVTISNVSLKVYNSDPDSSTDITTSTDETQESTPANDETQESTPANDETQESTPANDETQESTPANDETQESTTPAQVTGPEYTYAAGSAALKEAAYLGGDVGANQYKAICGQGYVNGIVNIQKLPDAADYGIYVNFTDADFGEMTVNGKTLDCYLDGSGVIMYLSNFEYMYNDVVVKSSSGKQKAIIYVYNEQGIDNSDKILQEPETTTPYREPQDPATYAAGYNWTPIGIISTAGAGRGQFRQVSDIYGSVNFDSIKLSGDATEPGLCYIFDDDNFGEITVNGASLDCYIDGTSVTMYLSNFEYMYNDVIVKDREGSTKAIIYINNMKGTNNKDQALDGTPVIETTEAPTKAPTTAEPTTAEQTTAAGQNSITEPTTAGKNEETAAPITVDQDKTTVVTNQVKAPAKAKISKVTAKKKSAKKVKLLLKKISGAKGYQIAVYKTRKNAKNNKKAIVRKFVKKVNITVKSKKLKNKKKLFVRARAYVLDASGKKLYGKWSNVKKVKIKR